MAYTIVTSDFESTHEIPVKPDIVGLRPWKGQTWIFLNPYPRKRSQWVKKWLLFLARPRTSGLYRKLSVLHLSKAKNESFLTRTYVKRSIEFKNDCIF